MVSTVDAFNSTLKGFLEELVECCPSAPGVSTLTLFLATFDTFVATDPRAAMDGFLAAMVPHTDMVAAKNPKLFRVVTLPGGVSLKDAWDTMSDTTKAAVWQYVQMLFLLGNTATAMPPDMLNAIENVAQTYASKIQGGEMDMASLTSMLMGTMGGEGSEGGAGNPLLDIFKL